jgi:hypothetical protein
MKDDSDRLFDYLESREDEKNWRPSRPENQRYLLRYEPDKAVKTDGASFAAWHRIAFADVKKYDIVKMYNPEGRQIAEGYKACADDRVIICGGDAEKNYDHGHCVGYSLPITFFVSCDHVEPLTEEDRNLIDQWIAKSLHK